MSSMQLQSAVSPDMLHLATVSVSALSFLEALITTTLETGPTI